MIARHRGDTRRHSRWRPAAPAAAPPVPPAPELLGDDTGEARAVAQAQIRPRGSRALIALATVIGIAVIAAAHRGAGTREVPLPSTPQQWVDQWTGASVENPAGVCRHLFAPALAAAFAADTGRTCTRYYASLSISSFRVRHVFSDGPTATVEARQVAARAKWGYFTIVLSHLRGGWQAVDIIPGGSVRPR